MLISRSLGTSALGSYQMLASKDITRREQHRNTKRRVLLLHWVPIRIDVATDQVWVD